ncbi:MAG: hypothetical protein MUC69_06270 [Gemmatimonadales bacterium]|nr:hypothetical protein [Gemmatimonadales bacterium]
MPTHPAASDSPRAGDAPRQPFFGVPAWVVVALALLALPAVAMRFTDEVAWTGSDFVVAALLLFGTGLTYELVARRSHAIAYRVAVAMAVVGALLLVWVNLAVGMIGSEDHPANLLYLGVLAVGVVGAGLARLRPRGMALAMLASAAAMGIVAVVTLVAGWGAPAHRPLEVLLLNGLFALPFLGAAWLFRRSDDRAAPPR